MTRESSPEYVAKALEAADQALSDARYLLEDGRLQAAANRIYYAAFYATEAALCHSGHRPSRSHGGVLRQFEQVYVHTGMIDRQLGRLLRDTYNLRRMGDYQFFATIAAEDVGSVVDDIAHFMVIIKDLVGQ